MSLYMFGRSKVFLGRGKVSFFIFCALACGILPSAQAQLDISGGSPVYRVPVSLPPGVGGMVPRLALEFNAGSTASGLGWAIKGVSVITRCPSNKIIDGQSRGVSFSQDDRLCLDGQRLIQTDENGGVKATQQDDSLGGNGAVREYRTETDSFARIRAYGMAEGNAVNGPAYFKVWTKSGQIIEYGINSNAGSNARIMVQGRPVVASWAVSRVSDLKGNYIDFFYDQRDVATGSAVYGAAIPGREWKLSEIRYTGNGTQAPASKVVFEYADRSGVDRSESFQQGAKAVNVWRLSNIKTYVSNVPVKTLVLTYETGPVSRRSRPQKIQECAGDGSAQKCLPPTKFNYTPEATPKFVENSRFRNYPPATSSLTSTTGNYGVLVGDFFGKGRTDILRWSDDVNQNELYRSDGYGIFTKVGNGIGQRLVSSDGCYASQTADFNGDGLTDILRIMKATSRTGTSCGTVSNILFFAKGDGTFTSQSVGIDFTQKLAKVTHYSACMDSMQMSTSTASTTETAPARAPIPANHAIAVAPSSTSSSQTPRPRGSEPIASTVTLDGGSASPDLQNCPGGYALDGSSSQASGRTFHVADVNNDGLLDILTTELPGFSRTWNPPDEAAQCAGRICTRLYTQQASGAFVETSTNLASRSVYTDPPTVQNTFWRQLDQADMNGDKLVDLVVDSGLWISRGDGNFDLNTSSSVAYGCQHPIDFNGDGRIDCLPTPFNNPAFQSMYMADGSGVRSLSNFNLTQPGQELLQASPEATIQTAGIDIADVDGDGRDDIIRWKDDPAQNAVYLSNGDGSFTVTNGLGLAGIPLQKSDGSYTFITGDFTGNGNVEILRMSAANSSLYVKEAAAATAKEFAMPPDQLASVVTGTGVTTKLTWVSLTTSTSGPLMDRYVSDRLTSNRATYPVVDVMHPMYVVATASTDDATGAMKQVTEFSYTGLKGSYDGRGFLGFRETREQTSAPNGEAVTEVTQYLQSGLYVGKPSVIEMRRGGLKDDAARVLSRTTSIYCDTTSPTPYGQGATKDVPCATSAKVRRPYLYRSTEETWDLNGAALPVTTTTNTPNGNGDLLNAVVARTGTPSGLPAQSSTRTVTNAFYPNNTAGDNWMLGQLERSTVTNSVSNSIDSIATTGPAPVQPPVPPTAPAPTPVPVQTWLPAIMSLLLDSD